MKKWLLTWVTPTLVLVVILAWSAKACNEAMCGSIVSKCSLLKSCECEMNTETECTCCDRCKKCLGYLYSECCSCVGMCPKPNVSDLAHESFVFDFDNPPTSLWDAVTGSPSDERWDMFTYPVDLHPAEVIRTRPPNPNLVHQETMVVDKADKVTVNCTVAFLSECMSKTKCKKYCPTMGATSARWFADGCCECVGHNCRDYGVNEAR